MGQTTSVRRDRCRSTFWGELTTVGGLDRITGSLWPFAYVIRPIKQSTPISELAHWAISFPGVFALLIRRRAILSAALDRSSRGISGSAYHSAAHRFSSCALIAFRRTTSAIAKSERNPTNKEHSSRYSLTLISLLIWSILEGKSPAYASVEPESASSRGFLLSSAGSFEPHCSVRVQHR